MSALNESYTKEELVSLLGKVGDFVSVNRSVVFYSPKNIEIGSHVRIDSFVVISASPSKVVIDNHVHIGSHCTLIGSGGRIHLESFTGLSARTSIFTATDDYSQGFLTNPTVPDKYRNVRTGIVHLKKHAIVGCGSVILPNVVLGLASSVGALSVVNKSVPDFKIVSGNPVRIIGTRNPNIINLERELLNENSGSH